MKLSIPAVSVPVAPSSAPLSPTTTPGVIQIDNTERLDDIIKDYRRGDKLTIVITLAGVDVWESAVAHIRNVTTRNQYSNVEVRAKFTAAYKKTCLGDALTLLKIFMAERGITDNRTVSVMTEIVRDVECD